MLNLNFIEMKKLSEITNWQEMIGEVVNADCLSAMKLIPDSSIDLIVTSPPYNKGHWSMNRNPNNGFKTKSRRIEYGDFNDDLSPEDYENQQRIFIKECLRILMK